MIRSRKAHRNHFAGASSQGIAEQKLQFADFVAAVDHAAQVVALDVKLVQAEFCAHLIQPLDGRRKQAY